MTHLLYGKVIALVPNVITTTVDNDFINISLQKKKDTDISMKVIGKIKTFHKMEIFSKSEIKPLLVK